MSEAATEDAGGSRVVSKKHLCEELGWSRMKLDRRLEEDATFPVLQRGDQGAPWSFDLDAVREYLEPEEERDLLAEDLATPAGQAARLEMTARQRRDLAQAQLHEDKLRRMRSELVEAGPLTLTLSESVTKVSVALNSMADVLVRRLNLPESALPIIRQEIDEVRRQLVTGLRELLADD